MLSPPTDNLYKFLAIFGLVLIWTGAYAAITALRENNRAAVEWNGSVHTLIEKERFADDDASERLKCAIARADAREHSRAYSPTEQCKGMDTEENKAEAEYRENLITLAELQGRHGVLEFLRKQAKITVVFGAISGTLGLGLSIVGFWLWYTRLQRYQDKEIKEKQPGHKPWRLPR